MNTFRKFLRDEEGVTALEYGLLAALVAAALALVAGPALKDFFTDLFDRLGDVVDDAFSP